MSKVTCQISDLKFSSCRGSNVFAVSANTVLGCYKEAHGQFMLDRELYQGQTFELEFRGKGFLKIQGFYSKTEAEEWVRSKRTLSDGSIRIRTMSSLIFHVACFGQTISLSTGNETNRQNRLNGSILAFDIEFGDIIVMIISQANSPVKFHDTCHSPHIQISNAPRLSHANLSHFNPTSLCTLENCTVSPGDTFKLAFSCPERLEGKGNYVRVSVSRKHSEHNVYGNGQEACSGKSQVPEFKGKRLMIKSKTREVLILKVEKNGLTLGRNGKQETYLKAPMTLGDLGLWFELHNVLLEIWSIRIVNPTDQHESLNIGPPNYPAPLPPDDAWNNSSDPLNHYISLIGGETSRPSHLNKAGNGLSMHTTDQGLRRFLSQPTSRETNDAYEEVSSTAVGTNNLSIISPSSRFLSVPNIPAASNRDNISVTSESPTLQDFDSGSSYWIEYDPEPQRNPSNQNTCSILSRCSSMTSEQSFNLFPPAGNTFREIKAFSDSHAIGINVGRTETRHKSYKDFQKANRNSDDNLDAVSQFSELTIDDRTYLKRSM